MAKFIRVLGSAMTVFFSLGAVLGAMGDHVRRGSPPNP